MSPSSYSALPYRAIKVSHVPESSPTPTAVILITLNRPDKLNTFNEQMRAELEEVYSLIDKDPPVKAVVLTGAGKAFCAGIALETVSLGPSHDAPASTEQRRIPEAEHRDSGGRVVLAIHRCSKPTIAAINGAAVGVGITMCLPACICVAYSKAKIGFVFAQRGILMEACSSFFLPRLIGHARALHLVTTGSVYPASSPYFGSLFTDVLDTPEATVARALEMARDVAKNTSIVSNKIMRDMMYRGPNSAEAAHLLDSRMIGGMSSSQDKNEGIQSFLEKRPANFTGTLAEDKPESYPWWYSLDLGEYHPNAGDPSVGGPKL